MSLFEGWFKNEKEKEVLQKVVDDTITVQQLQHKLNEDKYEASQIPDDQELNIGAQAYLFGKELELNPEEAEKVEEKMKTPTEENDGSNYLLES